MKISKKQMLQGALIVTIALSFGLASADSWAGRNKGKSQTCFKTTRVMHKACRADITDDYFESSAKCLNSDDVRDCRRDAQEEYRDGWGECWEEAGSRDSLCERLPDAGPYIADLDPNDFTGQCSGGNAYFPLIPGTVTTFVNDSEEDGEVVQETIVVTVTDETREIEGIETIVVRDTVYEGLPDDDGNPDGDRIEDAGAVLDLNAEIYDEEGETVTFDNAAFDCLGQCLKTEDFIGNEPDGTEFKFFKARIGFVAEQLPDGQVVLKIIK